MGENIALNQSTPEIVVEDWASSPTHYLNMTNTRYSSVGIGCCVMSDGTRGWVQMFSSAEATEVQKSGKITAEHKIDAKLKYLNLRLSAQDDIHNLNKGEKGVLKVVNHNKGWDRSRQIMDLSLFEFAGFDDSIATVSPDGVVEAMGEGLLKITATLKQYPELVVEYWQQIGHVYENDCDRFCSVCYEKREITHTYDNSCDTICNICGEVRSIKHTYDNACDTTCNVCDEVRSITHCYYNACDKDCNVCGQERTVPDHVYDNACDTTCNICGTVRPITHDYKHAKFDDNHHWQECDCGAVLEKINHKYDILKKDENEHWNECACGKQEFEHRFSHGFSRVFDQTQHWLECECGAFADIQPHEFDH
jgi:hypothetical protein